MLSQKARSGAAASVTFRDLTVLFKLRIVVLLLLAAVGGEFLGASGWPGLGNLLLILVTGTLAAAGSSALNEYIERDKDALMLRTRKRPLVAGTIPHPGWVPVVAFAMILAPVLAVLPFNPALSTFLALGAVIYVGIYTLWLKPRTSLNIVIGGLAGSAAVLSGGAAAGAWSNPGVLLLALLLFFWTPIHFWALAIVYREDYARADVPMLPVRSTPQRAAGWGLAHGLAAGLSGVAMPLVHPHLGVLYIVPVAVASVVLVYEGARLVGDPAKRRAWHLFHTSNLFLAAVLVFVCLDAVLHIPLPLIH